MQLSRRRDGEQRICENRRGEKKTIVDTEAAAAAASRSKKQPAPPLANIGAHCFSGSHRQRGGGEMTSPLTTTQPE